MIVFFQNTLRSYTFKNAWLKHITPLHTYFQQLTIACRIIKVKTWGWPPRPFLTTAQSSFPASTSLLSLIHICSGPPLPFVQSWQAHLSLLLSQVPVYRWVYSRIPITTKQGRELMRSEVRSSLRGTLHWKRDPQTPHYITVVSKIWNSQEWAKPKIPYSNQHPMGLGLRNWPSLATCFSL